MFDDIASKKLWNLTKAFLEFKKGFHQLIQENHDTDSLTLRAKDIINYLDNLGKNIQREGKVYNKPSPY